MVLYLYVAVFLTRIGFGSITILFPLYLQAPSYIIGVILALYPMSEAGSALPIGRLADRFSRKRLHIIGMIMITFLTAAIGFTRNILYVSGLHAAMGVAAAAAAVTSLTLLGDATKLTNRGTRMGGFDLANLGGYGLGFGVGGLLVNVFGPNDLSRAFWVTAGLFLFAGLMAAKFLVEPVRVWELKQPKIRQRNIGAKIRPVIPVWIAQTIILGMYFLLPKAFVSYSIPLTHDTLIFLGVLGGLFALGGIIFGHVSDKIGRTRVMVMGAFGELGFLVLFGWSFPRFVDYELFLWPMFFLASSIAPTILAYIADISGKAKRGSANALYSIVLSIGLAIGNIIGGFAVDLGIKWIFYAGAGILFPSILVTSGLLRRRN